MNFLKEIQDFISDKVKGFGILILGQKKRNLKMQTRPASLSFDQKAALAMTQLRAEMQQNGGHLLDTDLTPTPLSPLSQALSNRKEADTTSGE